MLPGGWNPVLRGGGAVSSGFDLVWKVRRRDWRWLWLRRRTDWRSEPIALADMSKITVLPPHDAAFTKLLESLPAEHRPKDAA